MPVKAVSGRHSHSARRRQANALARKVAIVTGGASGIGRACAAAFHREGYAVAIIDMAAHRSARAGELMVSYACDVTRAAEVRRTVRRIGRFFGRIDVVINCAGVLRDRPFAVIDDPSIDQLIAVNLRGTINVARATLPALSRSKGTIINISSAQAHRPSPGLAVYAATKGAVESLTKALAVELAPRGIRVNAVSPGLIRTPILLTQAGVTPRRYEAYVRRRARGYLLGRIGEAEEIAAMVIYLASGSAAWITGAIVPVDGGKSVGGG